MAGGVLEVQGVPPDAPEELLVLYFESRRRSGGGPVQSCQRLGPLLFLTFEDPQDAQNVLAHGSHRLGGAELRVRPAPPWDPTHLLLRGLNPRTPPEHLDLPLETLLGVPPGAATLCQGSVPGWSLLRLQDPLSPPELASAEQRARQRGLALLRAPQSPAVLVRAAGPAPSRDLLELYFENRRSGGGRVRDVRLLPGGRGAIVTFQEPAAAGRVLRRPQRLQDVVLEVAPHYPFLEPLEGSTDLPLDTVPALDRAPSPDAGPLLVTDPLLDVNCRPDTDPSSDTDPAMAHTNPPPDTAAAVPLPAAPALQPLPGQPAPAFPGGDKDAEGFRAMPSQAQRPGPVSVVVPEPMSAALAQDEALVPAEPGALRYLQQHYQDVLGSIPDVSLLPLEGEDISGFRVSGELSRCQAVADFLQSLLDSVASHPTTLRFPGVARFLRDPAGQSLLQQLESRFQCVIQVDGEPWSPPDPQLELEELLPPSSHGVPRSHSWHRDLPDGNNSAEDDSGGSGDNGFRSSAEEIKEVLAALHPSDADNRGTPNLWPDPVPGNEWDPDAELPCAAGGEGAGELLSDTRVEEEVQMALAIQYSMDSTWCEEQELARATALSLRSYCREQEQEQAEEDAGLLAALEASLEEALLAADVARVTVFCSFEQDVSAVPRELERALAGRLRAQEVASERLRALPAAGHCALALLRRRHAVHLSLRGDTATLRGFAEYTAPAAQDLMSLLQRLPLPEPGATAVTTATAATAASATTAHWVRWDASGTAVPYAPETAALLEEAWLRQERRLDLVLDGRPLTVDLERMEEFDIGSARAVPVCRSQPPLDSTCCLLGPEVPGLEEEVRLMALAEDSEEFADTVHRFYGTLEELHSQISIVQVQKLIHPVLYKQYQLKKGSVKRASAAGTTVERVLFHGTTKASSREICLHGFNRSFCGKNATLYGLGVYFAARAAISARDRYSPPSANGTKFIFVAKVLTGEFTAGHPGLRAPPLREGSGVPRRYHSVVDDPRQPDIFVIFNDTQAYPQYLITCRSRHRGPL